MAKKVNINERKRYKGFLSPPMKKKRSVPKVQQKPFSKRIPGEKQLREQIALKDTNKKIEKPAVDPIRQFQDLSSFILL